MRSVGIGTRVRSMDHSIEHVSLRYKLKRLVVVKDFLFIGGSGFCEDG